ncbi:MAG: Shikimate kinase [Promethearchaeota archaeon]|jgi:shikimate kinase|nr:MAG: Shikimate kinase [Candidatus Lokiarchaeota archaeon]
MYTRREMKKCENITLIGMPGSGKSTIGKLLADELDFDFIDTDDYIEEKEGRNLQEIIDTNGNEKFCEIEEEAILELLPLQNSVISPGGSVIYSKTVMNKLNQISTIIFLDLPLEVLKERLDNKESRGIVGLDSLSLPELYQERITLYNKYSNLTIDCNGLSPDEIINLIKVSLK